MRESMDTFVRVPQNEKAYIEVEAIKYGVPHKKRFIIQGPNRSGKSTLLRGLGEDAIRSGAEMQIFTCSGADIAMALQIDADDSFFERLGETPSLLIDDIDRLFTAEKGDQLLSLLIEERNKHDLCTVLVSRNSLKDMDLEYSKELLQDFDVVEMGLLTLEDRVLFVELAEDEYRRDTSPSLEQGVAQAIVELFPEDYYNMENAMRYLLTDEDCCALGTVTVEKARELLTK